MTFGLTVLETELPVPPFVFGIVAFALLIALLLATIAIGNGRPHS